MDTIAEQILDRVLSEAHTENLPPQEEPAKEPATPACEHVSLEPSEPKATKKQEEPSEPKATKKQEEPSEDLQKQEEPSEDLKKQEEPSEDLKKQEEPSEDLKKQEEPSEALTSKRAEVPFPKLTEEDIERIIDATDAEEDEGNQIRTTLTGKHITAHAKIVIRIHRPDTLPPLLTNLLFLVLILHFVGALMKLSERPVTPCFPMH